VYDEHRVQDVVLALMHLNAHKDSFGWRALKSFPWEATDGLHERGLISDPRSKAKSVALTDEDEAREHGWRNNSSPNSSRTATRTRLRLSKAPVRSTPLRPAPGCPVEAIPIRLNVVARPERSAAAMRTFAASSV
jgi:hypothetical protein